MSECGNSITLNISVWQSSSTSQVSLLGVVVLSCLSGSSLDQPRRVFEHYPRVLWSLLPPSVEHGNIMLISSQCGNGLPFGRQMTMGRKSYCVLLDSQWFNLEYNYVNLLSFLHTIIHCFIPEHDNDYRQWGRADTRMSKNETGHPFHGGTLKTATRRKQQQMMTTRRMGVLNWWWRKGKLLSKFNWSSSSLCDRNNVARENKTTGWWWAINVGWLLSIIFLIANGVVCTRTKTTQREANALLGKAQCRMVRSVEIKALQSFIHTQQSGCFPVSITYSKQLKIIKLDAKCWPFLIHFAASNASLPNIFLAQESLPSCALKLSKHVGTHFRTFAPPYSLRLEKAVRHYHHLAGWLLNCENVYLLL